MALYMESTTSEGSALCSVIRRVWSRYRSTSCGGSRPNSVVTVEGFADPSGPRAYNEQLSQHRAENVASFLKTEAGLMVAEIKSVGYGETRLVTEGAYGPGSYGLENRRVAFVVEQAGAIEEMEEETDENAEKTVTTGL